MLDEQLEFAISQYADGTLPLAERAALESRLSQDAVLRDLLEDYRKLDTAFTALAPVPSIAWDRLARQVSNAVAEADVADEAAAYKMPARAVWGRRVAALAIAASVLIVVSIGLRDRTGKASSSPGHAQPQGELLVTGPAPEAASGAAMQQITIGPSPSLAMSDSGIRYGDSGVVVRPQRVVIASGDEPAQDTSNSFY